MADSVHDPDSANTIDTDILVVGAGMVGAAIALGAASAGFRVTLIDKAIPPEIQSDAAPDLRVSALSLASEQLLRRLGAWPHIESRRCCPYRRMHVWEALPPGGPASLFERRLNQTRFNSEDIGQSHLGHIVENRVTQLALLDEVRQSGRIDIRAPALVRQLKQQADAVTMTLDDGTSLSARLVVGADGAQSQVRQLAGIGLTSDQYEQQAMVVTVSYSGQQEDITWQAFHPSGPRAFLPLPDIDGKHYGSLVWYDSPEVIRQLMAMEDNRLLQRIHDAFPSELPPLTGLHGKGSFPLVKRHAQSYFAGRVVLAGDAAHTINPLAGQGVNLGFQDVAALLSCLSANYADSDPGAKSVLSEYESRRRARNQRMMQVMDLFYYLFSNNTAPLKAARNIGLTLAERLPLGKKLVMRYAMGIDDPMEKLGRWLPPLPARLFNFKQEFRDV